MAINFDALRKRLDHISGKDKQSNAAWKPKEGEESTVRLLSFPNNDGQPFKEILFYYNIGNSPGIVAPYQFGKQDPFQDLITKLRDEGTKESYELAKKLYPKMRCYAPVIVRGEEEKGVQLWAFGKQVYQSILNIMLDEDFGDITDPREGRDVKVRCHKPQGKKYTETEVQPRGKSSPLSPSTDTIKLWLANIPDTSTMFTPKSSDELTKIINDWINNGSPTESDGTTRGDSSALSNSSSDEESIVERKTDATAKPQAKKTGNFKSLDDAFSDLIDS